MIKCFNADLHEAVTEITAPSEEMKGKIIDEVMKGGASMSPSIALKVMRYFNQQVIIPNYKLTPKETEVLKHLAEGFSYKMIADKMGISYFTVNNHVKKVYEKLQVHSLGEAVALAHKQKLL